MSGSIFRHRHRVTYAECTVGNHVYYARYLDILEEARGEFFRSLGAPLLRLQEQGILLPVIEAHLNYRSPARYDEVLSIDLWVPRTDRVRLNFAYRIANEAFQLILEAGTSHVCTTPAERPKRLPENLIDSLAPYLSETPTASR
jgi:acyl-CoA thioester hydrolase